MQGATRIDLARWAAIVLLTAVLVVLAYWGAGFAG
jgi:hypothetical protein